MNEDWKGLNLAELIDLLEPVPEPPPVSMLPQTAGWIWLALLLLAIAFYLIRRFWHSWQRNAYRRAALSELAHCSGDIEQLARLVRRTALAAYPRARVASLFGKDWLQFLDRAYGGDGFSNGPGKVLATGPYRGGSAEDRVEELVRVWIKQHQRDGGHV